MNRLFEKWNLAGRTVKNRLSTLPMEGNDAEPDGRPSQRTIKRYERLSTGGWGIVYIEAIAPDERGKARPGQLVLTEENLDSFKSLVSRIRAASPDPPLIIFQINHAGRYALNPTLAYHSELLDPTWNIPPDMPEATTDELDAAARACAGAVRLAAASGADAADLKCCHGYLAMELLRPANTRTDKFGGSLKNRLRFLEILLDAAQEVSGPHFFFGSRISLLEGFPGGFGSGSKDPLAWDTSELFPLLMTLMSAGAAFVCGTLGVPYYNPELVRPWKNYDEKLKVAAMHHRLCAWVKENFPSLAVISAGYSPLGEASPDTAGENISRGLVDAAGFGRQSFADPEMPLKLLRGDTDSINWCKGCKTNNCSFLLRNRVPTGCVIFESFYSLQLKKLKKEQKEKDDA